MSRAKRAGGNCALVVLPHAMVGAHKATVEPLECRRLLTVFVVTSTGDNGGVNPAAGAHTGTLRQAIVDLDASGTSSNAIDFAIAGGAQQTIVPLSPLPAVTRSVTIDGTSQTGYDPIGHPLIELNGSKAGPTANGLVIRADDVIVRALVINRFHLNGIEISSGASSEVQGSYIGTDPGGTLEEGNGADGILVNGATFGDTIGGSIPADRDVINSNGTNGIEISGSHSNYLEDNAIGTDLSGTDRLGNGGDGVLIDNGASGNFIGGNADADSNTIAFNGASGVAVTGNTSTGNSIRLNSIFANVGLGIDLGADGITPDDATDGDIGPNDLQNFPFISAAVSNAFATTVDATLHSSPNTDYVVDVYTTPATGPGGAAQAKVFLGDVPLRTDATGSGTFVISFQKAVAPGDLVTATATATTNDDTSEFSSPAIVTTPESAVAPNPAALYPFDESSGTHTADSTGDGNNGTLVNGPAFVPANRGAGSGNALWFNGTNQYVSVPNSALLNPTQAISLSAWINATDWNGNRRILEKGANDTQYRLTAESGLLKFELAGVGTITAPLPSTGVWHLITGTWDGSVMTLYVDGKAVASANHGGTISITADALVIGSKNNTTTNAGNFFHGLIDQVRIDDVALTAQQVQAMFAPAMVAYYNFDQTQGPIASDLTGDGNNATLLDGATLAPAGRNPGSGNALSLNGINQSAVVDDNPTLDATGGITLSAWIDATTWTGGNRRILQKGANDDQYRLLEENGVLKFDLAGVGTVTTTLPSTGQWHLITGTWDGSKMILYVDGVARASLSATGSINITSDPLVIGSKNTTTTTAGNFFDGLIDDVRIYAGALVPSAVADLFSAG